MTLWLIDGAWRPSAAPDIQTDGEQIFQLAFSTDGWHAAVVPTVLTTLVDRGVYPNPYYGLNNLCDSYASV